MNHLSDKEIRLMCLRLAVEVLVPNRFRFTAAKEVTGPFLEAAKQFYDFVDAGEKGSQETPLQRPELVLNPTSGLIELENLRKDIFDRPARKTDIYRKWKQAVILPGPFTFEEAVKACPKGYRLPTEKEGEELINNTAYNFDKKAKEGVFRFADGFELRLLAVGIHYADWVGYKPDECGCYWLFSRSDTNTSCICFDASGANAGTNYRVIALSALYLPIDVEPN